MRHGDDHRGSEHPLVRGSNGVRAAARLVLAAMGALVLACGLGWLLFLAAFVTRSDPTQVWILAALALLAIPCFSFGRQWLLEGLGRAPAPVGARWRPAVAGLILMAYGAAFILGPTQVGDDGASAAAHGTLALSLTPAGLLMVVAGLALAVRQEPPPFLLAQMSVLLVLCGLGTAVTLTAYLSEGVEPPGVVSVAAVLLLAYAVVRTRHRPEDSEPTHR